MHQRSLVANQHPYSPDNAVELPEMADLFAHSVQFDGQNACVMFKVLVGGKDSPTPRIGHGANQSVHKRHGNALTLALIAGLSGELVVHYFDIYIRKSSKPSTKHLKLRRISYT
jgi:hypothetical protein